MRWLVALALVAALAGRVTALDLDVTLQDIDRALTIARASDAERARFHAPYIREIDTPFVERTEIVSEFRRVVLLAEDRQRRGDRLFAYSTTQAARAVDVWKKRVALVARVRFHPQNVYVSLPDIDVRVVGNDSSRIGVIANPILSLPPGRSGDFVPILGATVEGVFDAQILAQGTYIFVISIAGQEVGAVSFDLATLD